MRQVFTSWSGGKDSCLACYRAIANGLKVSYLANTVTEDGKRSCSHGLAANVIRVQSQAMGIPLVQRRSTLATYETDFQNAILPFKEDGVEGGVFGDIDFQVHRDWIEQTCQQIGITPHLPLWEIPQEKIMKDFIALGFEAIIVAAKADLFNEEWLGRRVDADFLSHLSELKESKGVSPCGEAGEYHTLVTDGPLFKQKLEITEADKVLKDGYRFWVISKSKLSKR